MWKSYNEEVQEHVAYYDGLRNAPLNAGYSVSKKIWRSDIKWFMPLLGRRLLGLLRKFSYFAGLSYVAQYACLPVTAPLSWVGKTIAPYTAKRNRYYSDKALEVHNPYWQKGVDDFF